MRLRTRKRRRVAYPSKARDATGPAGVKPSPARLMTARSGWMLCAAIGAAAALYCATRLDAESWIGQLRLFASPTPPPTESRPQGPAWVATAPGRVEPVSGEVRIGSLVLGRVAEILVKVSDRVDQGDLLVRLEDEEARARLTSAEAQVISRKRDRDSVPVTGAAADRRRAEDKVAAAERAVAAARRDLDRLSTGRAAPATLAALANAREAVAEAQRRLERERAELARHKAATAKAPGPLDTALTIARAELSAAEAMFEKSRARAPFAGTILQLPVRVGETVAPSPERALVVVADISQLRVRVDLDERNRGKVFVGQLALVRSEGFSDALNGKVAAIAPALVPAQTTAPGRRRPNEGSVLEVLVELMGMTQLMPGMQVDVFFLASGRGQ